MTTTRPVLLERELERKKSVSVSVGRQPVSHPPLLGRWLRNMLERLFLVDRSKLPRRELTLLLRLERGYTKEMLKEVLEKQQALATTPARPEWWPAATERSADGWTLDLAGELPELVDL